jgi:hypothetical protein
MTTLSHLLTKYYYTHRMNYLIKQKIQLQNKQQADIHHSIQ